jgi:hypothetical protein
LNNGLKLSISLFVNLPIAERRLQLKKEIMKIKFQRSLLIAAMLTAFSIRVYGQDNSTIEVRFLNAKFTDTTNAKNLMTVFIVSTKDTADFPPQINLPPKCTVFENGREKVVLLDQHNMGVSLYGDNIRELNKEAYTLVKNQIGEKLPNATMIIVYSLHGLDFEFRKMSLTPAFVEKRHKEVRVAKRFEFEVL